MLSVILCIQNRQCSCIYSQNEDHSVTGWAACVSSIRVLLLEVGVKAYMMYIISGLHVLGHIIRRGTIKKNTMTNICAHLGFKYKIMWNTWKLFTFKFHENVRNYAELTNNCAVWWKYVLYSTILLVFIRQNKFSFSSFYF